MKNLNNYIIERLHITKKTKANQYNEEELRKDYENINYAYTKASKQEIANKYDCTVLKIRDIQLVILDILRDLRHKKKDFTKEDLQDFLHYRIPQRYKQLKPYLEKEPNDFVEFLYNYYDNYCKQHNCKYKKYGGSYADNTKLETRDSLLQYLKEKHIIS